MNGVLLDTMELLTKYMKMASEIEETKENLIDESTMQIAALEQIILDALDASDLCSLCKRKGQVLHECGCTTDPECLENMKKLYRNN